MYIEKKDPELKSFLHWAVWRKYDMFGKKVDPEKNFSEPRYDITV